VARRVVTGKGKAVRLEGLAKLQEQMAGLMEFGENGGSANRATGQEVKRIYMGAALLLRDEARSRAPILKSEVKGHVPGLLKKAIFAAYGEPTKPSVLVGVNYKIAPHAWLVEFGTSQRSTKSGKSTGIGPAQPFMRPALTAVRSKCVAIIAEGLRGLIEKAAS
jgi:HK97 gp10 family phage protein